MAKSTLARLDKSNHCLCQLLLQIEEHSLWCLSLPLLSLKDTQTEEIGTQIKKKKILTRIKDEGDVDFII